MFEYFPVFSVMFYLMYLLCGLSDMIDGTIARKTNTASKFGAKLDTAADFVFIVVSLVKILPVLPIQRWLWIIVIAIIKVSNVIAGVIFRKRNRLNGIIELISDVVKGANTMSFEAFSKEEIEAIVEHTLTHMSPEGKESQIKQFGGEEKYRAYLIQGFQNEKAVNDILIGSRFIQIQG